VAKELQRRPLPIFPGFEVDIGYHALCLFQPAKKQRDIQRLNMILTNWGGQKMNVFVLESRVSCAEKTTISLKAPLEIVQNQQGRIVIAAHADQAYGMPSLANNIADYQIPHLLAVEVATYPMPTKISSILDGCKPDWSTIARFVEGVRNGALQISCIGN